LLIGQLNWLREDLEEVMKKLSEQAKHKEVAKLKEELIETLKKLDAIAKLKFHDNDCDDCVYNFGDVAYDEEHGEVHVDLYMWEDKLPR